jgi:hypothetical protein
MEKKGNFMSYTKKTTKQTEEIKDTETIESVVGETTTKEVAKKTETKVKRTYTDSDYILCRSVWSGGLNVTCKSGNSYEFKDYGAECEINYRDLVSLIRKGSDHIFLPRFVILEEDLLEEFPSVQKTYEKMYTREDLVDILALPISQMKVEIAKLPAATQNVLCKMIATEIASGRLDSISKVRALSEIFDSDFNLLSELFVR